MFYDRGSEYINISFINKSILFVRLINFVLFFQNYINEVLSYQVLALSLQVRSFLDPDNYPLDIAGKKYVHYFIEKKTVSKIMHFFLQYNS